MLPKGVTATGSAVRLLPGVSGADTASAIRLTIIVHYSTTSATAALFADYVNFGYGQAEVQLVFGNRSPPSSTLESRLEALLVARARAVIG